MSATKTQETHDNEKMGSGWAKVESIMKGIEKVAIVEGKIGSWLLIPALLIILFDVTTRKVFQSPQSWAFDITYYLCGIMYVLCMSWIWVLKGHIAIDVLVSKLPQKANDIVQAVANIIMGIPLLAIMVIYGWRQAMDSTSKHEVTLSPAQLSLVPLRWSIPVGFAVMFVVLVVTLIRTIYQIRTGRSLETGDYAAGYPKGKEVEKR